MTNRDEAHSTSVAELEAEILRTRERLAHGLAALDREYGLRHLLVRGTRLVRGAEHQPGVLAETVRREILPLALIGTGLAWLALGRKESGDLLRRLLDSASHVQNLAKEFIALTPTRRSISASAPPAASDTGGTSHIDP